MNHWFGHIEQSICENRLFPDGEAILVAVSGGLDSMVLLHVLHRLSAKHHWKITVAHFNHQLRGRSSDADERLVCKTAKLLKLPIKTGRADVKNFARERGISIEMAARKLRHEFLAQTAKESEISVIALAHHAGDQVELFFLRLLRGAGGEGLAGMKWLSPSPADPKVTLVRPLLDQSKEALAQFARKNKIPFREDATNVCLDYQRNRIRHELLPLLKKYQPALTTNILRSMDIVRAEAGLSLQTARSWLGAHRPSARTSSSAPKARKTSSFQKLPLAVQRHVILLQLRELAIEPDFNLIEELRTNRQAVSVKPGQTVSCDAHGKVHLRAIREFIFETEERAISLSESSEMDFGGFKFSWQISTKPVGAPLLHPKKKSNCEYFDAAKIGNTITLRHWRPGDRFQPIGMKSPVKLQDLFVNLKIPRAERHRKIVALAENGEIFWVQGIRISECFKLDIRTRSRFKWCWQPL